MNPFGSRPFSIPSPLTFSSGGISPNTATLGPSGLVVSYDGDITATYSGQGISVGGLEGGHFSVDYNAGSIHARILDLSNEEVPGLPGELIGSAYSRDFKLNLADASNESFSVFNEYWSDFDLYCSSDYAVIPVRGLTDYTNNLIANRIYGSVSVSCTGTMNSTVGTASSDAGRVTLTANGATAGATCIIALGVLPSVKTRVAVFVRTVSATGAFTISSYDYNVGTNSIVINLLGYVNTNTLTFEYLTNTY